MATTKNLCAQIPIDLHERVSEERERLGQTTSEYIANLIQDYRLMADAGNQRPLQMGQFHNRPHPDQSLLLGAHLQFQDPEAF